MSYGGGRNDVGDEGTADGPASPQRLGRTRELMNNAVRDCLVTGHEPLVDELDRPDPNDKHVPAATIRTSAQVIFTSKLKDFRQQSLAAMIERDGLVESSAALRV